MNKLQSVLALVLLLFLSACGSAADLVFGGTAEGVEAYCEKYSKPEVRAIAHKETQLKLIEKGAVPRLSSRPFVDCDGDGKDDYTLELPEE